MQQLPVVDMLITKSNMELQETMNYWKQIPHIMKWATLRVCVLYGGVIHADGIWRGQVL